MTAPTAPGLLSVETARDAILALTEPVVTERVAAADALGRVAAAPVHARVSLPPWANSAMAFTAAISISSLMVVAPTSSAPRKMNGKHRTLLTWFG